MIPPDRFDCLLERPEIEFDDVLVRQRYRGACALVTGAGGSIGSALVRQLIELGAKRVICYESHEPSLFRLGIELRDLGPRSQAVLALGDARDGVRIDRLVAQYAVDAVFALAAYKQVPLAEENADQVASVNVIALADSLQVCEARGVADFVFPSSDKAVRPPSLYGATKRLAECAVLAPDSNIANTHRSVVRLVNVFGTAGNVIEQFAARFAAGQGVGVTDNRMTRYWMTRREAVWILLAGPVLGNGAGLYLGEVGEPVSLIHTTRRLASLFGVTDPVIDVVGVRPGERLSEELTYGFESTVATQLRGVLEIVPSYDRTSVAELVRGLRTSIASGDADGVGLILRDVRLVT